MTGAGAPADEEVPLPGGMGSGGAVVRVGDTVRRPVVAQTGAVEQFLAHLAASGFVGAPQPLGRDDKGRSVLTWMEGEVAMPPFPDWAGTEDALLSVAALQRAMHDASRSFRIPPEAPWYRPNLGPAGPGAVVCHNDLCVENVVFRNGRATAFIDFDFAAPNDPLSDIAIACRHWVPFKDPVDITGGFEGVDQAARFRMFCDEHRLSDTARHAVVDHGLDFLDRALATMRHLAESGPATYAAVWERGYPEQNRRSHAWLLAQRGAIRVAKQVGGTAS